MIYICIDKEEKKLVGNLLKLQCNYFGDRKNTAPLSAPCHSTSNEDICECHLVISRNLSDRILIKLCIMHTVAYSLSCAFSILQGLIPLGHQPRILIGLQKREHNDLVSIVYYSPLFLHVIDMSQSATLLQITIMHMFFFILWLLFSILYTDIGQDESCIQ